MICRVCPDRHAEAHPSRAPGIGCGRVRLVELFCYLRRFVRLILLVMITLVFLKALFHCSFLDILLLVGLLFVFVVLVGSS